jgi:hypothetical protein
MYDMNQMLIAIRCIHHDHWERYTPETGDTGTIEKLRLQYLLIPPTVRR